ncbi:MAG: hypothetical protein M1475_00575, partial [Actinobacteria bacterium]|nr:hypothetical protein [Actinomycetota bacterium]
KIIDIDFDKRRMAFSIKQVTNPETSSEEAVKLDELPEEITADKEKIKKDKPQASDTVNMEKNAENEREKAIKEILKEMKDEANL